MENVLVKMGEYVVKAARGQSVPNDPVSGLIKETKRLLKIDKYTKGGSEFEFFKATFRHRLNDLGNYIFDNEPDLLRHMGGRAFENVMDDVVDAYRNVLYLLLHEIPEIELQSQIDKERAYRTLINAPEFVYSNSEKFKQ